MYVHFSKRLILVGGISLSGQNFTVFNFTATFSLVKISLLAQSESLPYWFGEMFMVVFVLIYRLREFPLSAVTNRFELSCQLRQLLLL